MAITVKKPQFLVKIDENSHVGLHIRKRRLELKLLQKDVATYIGVTEEAVTYWETGFAIPQIQYAPKVIAFLGYNPYHFETGTLGGQIWYYRLLHGLSHKKLGKLLGVDAATISTWEANKFKPNKENLETINVLLKEIPKTSSEADSSSAEAQLGKE